MKILDKAAKLEKALIDRLGRRTDIVRHPLELYRAVLDDIEDATEPGTRGGRIFPYNDVTVAIPTTDDHQRATAEAVFAEPPLIVDRVRTRLRHAGCRDVDGLTVTVTFVDGTSDEWVGRDYHIKFHRHTAPRSPKRVAKPRLPPPHELQLVVVAGTAARTRYTVADSRINIGRLENIVDRQQRIVRQNQIAFADSENDVNQSVSRTHAHVQFDVATGDARLHDDGSTHGTRVVRGGRTIEVPRGGRGIALRDGDEVQVGQARLRVTLRPVRKARTLVTRG